MLVAWKIRDWAFLFIRLYSFARGESLSRVGQAWGSSLLFTTLACVLVIRLQHCSSGLTLYCNPGSKTHTPLLHCFVTCPCVLAPCALRTHRYHQEEGRGSGREEGAGEEGAGHNAQHGDNRAAGRFSAPRGETLLLFPPQPIEHFTSARARATAAGWWMCVR